MTSEKRTHPEAMVKRFDYCRSNINNALYGRNWRQHDDKAMSSVQAIERHKSGNPHSHCLLRFPGGLPQAFVRPMQEVFTDSGGWCKLEVPRSQNDIVSYVTKYVCKDGDIIFSPNFQPLTRQKQIDQDALQTNDFHSRLMPG